MSKLSISANTQPQTVKMAVDGTPLEMSKTVSPPVPNPQPGNRVDHNSLNQVLQKARGHNSTAEYPLRKALRATTTTVFTNHFAIELDPKLPLYRYLIKGLPDRMSKKKAKIMLQDMIEKTPFLKNNQDKFATDHDETIVSWIRIPPDARGPYTIEPEDTSDVIEITLLNEELLQTDLLKQYVAGEAPPSKENNNETNRVTKALNVVVAKALSQDSFSLKANKFFVTGGHTPLSTSLCTMRGYFYNIKPGMGQMLLNLSACTSAFFQPILVSDFLMDNTTIKDQAERLSVLYGLKVHLTYEPKHNGKKPRSEASRIESSMKTICGTGKLCSGQTFTLKGLGNASDQEVTVQQHFQSTYNTPLRYPNLPTINCGSKGRDMWYPPEVLQILPYQIYKRKVPESLTNQMLEVACRLPSETRALIEHEGLRKLGLVPGGGPVPFLACPAIQIDTRMLQVPAAILSYPTVIYGGNGKVSWSTDAKDGKWNLNKRKFLRVNTQAQFKVFLIIFPQSDKSQLCDRSIPENVWQGFSGAAQQTYNTGRFICVGSTVCLPFTQPNVAPKVMDMAKSKGANFVVLLQENKNVAAYSIFKDLADRSYGFHALCLVWKGSPFQAQYWGNIMMKVNLKAGGVNHTNPEVSKIMTDTLVLGADVTHAGPGALQGTPSIAAMVGSTDKDAGKFLGSMRLQPKDSACEDIQDVEGMTLERIKAWFSANKRLPKNIMYYRDGVSESQYCHVKERELPQIRKAFEAAARWAKLVTNPKFKLTAIVVAKRHHVRFFPQSSNPSDAMPRNFNCKPGTLVDSGVTSPYFQSFYLQSHNSIKGTAKPAHYFVLVDEMGIGEVALQDFTHQLCYTYVRATMGVSYAPPTYYADRLCERGRCYLREFLAPTPGSRRDMDQRDKRRSIEQTFQTERERKFRSMRKTTETGKTVKSAAEKIQVDVDKAEVDTRLRQWTFEQAKKAFYPSDGPARNPWKDSLAETMFWM